MLERIEESILDCKELINNLLQLYLFEINNTETRLNIKSQLDDIFTKYDLPVSYSLDMDDDGTGLIVIPNNITTEIIFDSLGLNHITFNIYKND